MTGADALNAQDDVWRDPKQRAHVIMIAAFIPNQTRGAGKRIRDDGEDRRANEIWKADTKMLDQIKGRIQWNLKRYLRLLSDRPAVKFQEWFSPRNPTGLIHTAHMALIRVDFGMKYFRNTSVTNYHYHFIIRLSFDLFLGSHNIPSTTDTGWMHETKNSCG